MFRKRPNTSTTLLAWTVVKTRCPVSADWMAICAVSSSRISPTMILSGSWRRMDLAPSEGEPLFLIHRNLGDSLELILHGILDGDDLVLHALDLRQGGVEGGGLAASRRTGDQNHPVGFPDKFSELSEVFERESQYVQPQLCEFFIHGLLVQDPDDRVLAVNAGHDGDAEIDGPPTDFQLETAVLWHALFGDVQLGHDLDAGNDG